MAILEESGIEAEMESFYKNLFLIQDLYASGYRMADVGPDENGLVSTYSFFQLTFKLFSTQFKVKFRLKVFLLSNQLSFKKPMDLIEFNLLDCV